jgi:hypothetical protein
MARDAELADEEGIEGSVEYCGNLGGDRDTAAGKTQDDDVGTIPICAQV